MTAETIAGKRQQAKLLNPLRIGTVGGVQRLLLPGEIDEAKPPVMAAPASVSTSSALPFKGTGWLADQLGVSEQRARVLLRSGRVLGAVRDAVTGRWDVSKLPVILVRPGKRGPSLRAHRVGPSVTGRRSLRQAG